MVGVGAWGRQHRSNTETRASDSWGGGGMIEHIKGARYDGSGGSCSIADQINVKRLRKRFKGKEKELVSLDKEDYQIYISLAYQAQTDSNRCSSVHACGNRDAFLPLWTAALKFSFSHKDLATPSRNPGKTTYDQQSIEGWRWFKNIDRTTIEETLVFPAWGHGHIPVLKGLQISVWSEDTFVLFTNKTTDLVCASKVRWNVCVCPGCNCASGMAKVSLEHKQLSSTSDRMEHGLPQLVGNCSTWYAKMDTALRVYVSFVRGALLSKKTVCCQRPADDILKETTPRGLAQYAKNIDYQYICKGERAVPDVTALTKSISKEKSVVPPGWKDNTESFLASIGNVNCIEHMFVTDRWLRPDAWPKLKETRPELTRDTLGDSAYADRLVCAERTFPAAARQSFTPLMGKYYLTPKIELSGGKLKMSCGKQRQYVGVTVCTVLQETELLLRRHTLIIQVIHGE